MSQSLNVIEIMSSILIIAYALFLILYLTKKSNSYPYKVISPYWVIMIIISTIISQAYTTCTTYLNNLEYYQLFHIVFISNLKLLCLTIRCYSLNKLVKYSSSHLNPKFFYDSYSFKKRLFKRKFQYFKTFIAVLIILSLITFTLMGNNTLLKGLKIYHSLLYNSLQSNHDLLTTDLTKFTAWCICNKLLTYSFLSVYAYYCITLMCFNFKKDYFGIQIESIFSLLIQFTLYNMSDVVFFVYKIKISLFFLLLSESILNGGILLLHGILIKIRHDAFKLFSINDLVNNFNKMLNCPATFKLFADYIKTKDESNYKLILFWVDYIVFENEANNFKADSSQYNHIRHSLQSNIEEESYISQQQYIINENKEKIKRSAQTLFKEYFLFNNNEDDSFSKTNSTIEFPIDILEKIEKIIYESFAFDVDQLLAAYSEAFNWVSLKLEKQYKDYIEDREEKDKMERIMFDIYCFEIINLKNINLMTIQANYSNINSKNNSNSNANQLLD